MNTFQCVLSDMDVSLWVISIIPQMVVIHGEISLYQQSECTGY